MAQKRKRISKILIIICLLVIVLLFAICIPKKENNIVNQVHNKPNVTAKTWQDDCLNSKVYNNLKYLYKENGTSGTLDVYYKNLKENFEDNENLYVDKFKEEYEKINYETLNQTQKDILNGLLYCWAYGKTDYFSFDIPVEKAWIVGEGENNTNPQKHRKIVLKTKGKYSTSSASGLEMSFWINKNNIEEHKAGYYFFGDINDPSPYTKNGINDISSDSGIWENYLSDYYNNEKYVSLDVNEINKTIEDNKEFLTFMKEYLNIYYKDVRDRESKEYNKQQEMKSKEPAIGMTKDEVLNGAWGSPKDKNVTQNRYGTYEQWVYGGGKYIYFTNGIVTSITK